MSAISSGVFFPNFVVFAQYDIPIPSFFLPLTALHPTDIVVHAQP